MAVEPVFEKIVFTGNGKELTDRIKAECKVDVDSEDVKRIINVSATALCDKSEIVNEEIKYNGKASFFICYENGEGEIRKKECTTEFEGVLSAKGTTESCKAELTASIDKTDVNLSGIKLNVTAFLNIKGEIIYCEESDALVGGDSIITEEGEINTFRSLGIKDSTYPIEEEIEIGAEIKEVINHNAEASITSVQCGVGCIIADGEVYLSLIALKNSDKTEIIKEEKTIPFRVEIDCEEAMPSNFATASVQVKSFKTDIYVSEDTNKSTAQASVILALKGEAFETKMQNVAIDAFSLSDDISLVKKDCEIQSGCEVRSTTSKISGRCNVEEITEGAELCVVTGEKAEIISSDFNGGVLKISGIYSSSGIFIGTDGRIFSRKMETPFEVSIEDLQNCSSIFRIKCAAHGGNAKVVSPTEVDVEGTISITLYPKEMKKICVISGINSNGVKKTESSAISVYIASEGETLWQLAKRLNICPEGLVESNKELHFPLTGKERIVVYRQK